MLRSNNIEFNPRSHRYKIRGSKPAEYIPSVTTICGLLDKPFLVEWAAREAATETALAMATQEHLDEQVIAGCIATGRAKHRELRVTGANTGTAVHQRIKQILMPDSGLDEELVDGGIDADLAMEAFGEWWNQTQADGWRVVYCERIVVHPSGKFVGTFDCLLQHKDSGAFRLIDFKTSNQSEDNPLALYPEYLFQVAAYRKAIIESDEYADVGFIDDAQVVALGKHGVLGASIFTDADLDVYADAFMCLVGLFPTYRLAQRDIRALNKVEKARRLEESGDGND